ncbi:MAG: hypothetical protein VYE30_10100 [Pseudomonadota bacterium]|nr:hypothetical protein [Pseudomonadota bacterium]
MIFFSQSLCKLLTALTQILLLGIAILSLTFPAAQENMGSQMVGEWIINDDLSDNTDDQVEEAIEAGGGDGGRGFFNRQEDFYRGGPPEHELDDRISYDDLLTIEYSEPEFRFTYEDNYFRIFHTDGRRRRTTANDFFEGGGTDWSEGNFENEALVVEARPRDGGFATEIYTLENDGYRLRIEMLIQPLSFREPIELVRYFDRVD